MSLTVGPLAPGGAPSVSLTADGAPLVIGSTAQLIKSDFSQFGDDLWIYTSDGQLIRVEGYFSAAEPQAIYSEQGARLTPEMIDALTGPLAPGQYAQASDAAPGEAIGQVSSLAGGAKATRTDGSTVDLEVGDPVFLGDVVRTNSGGELGITFVDGTIFALSANARMVLDELVYEAGGSGNAMGVSLIQGNFVFSTGEIAPTGGIEVQTPVGTIGIRGTMVGVQIDIANATTVANLFEQAKGKAGIFDFVNEAGAASFTQADEVLTILSLFALPGQPVVDAGLVQELFSGGIFLNESIRQLIREQRGERDESDNSIQETNAQTGNNLLDQQLADLGEALITGAGPQGALDSDFDGLFSQGSGFSASLTLRDGSTITFLTSSLLGTTVTTSSAPPSPSDGSTTVPTTTPPDPGDPTDPTIEPVSLDQRIFGTGANETFVTGAGNDFIDGAGGNDIITAGSGNDTVLGGTGDDVFFFTKGEGNDSFDGGAGFDTLVINGSAGIDSLVISGSPDSPVFTLTTGSETVTGEGIEDLVIFLGAGDDFLTVVGDLSFAGVAADTVFANGGAGNDVLDFSATPQNVVFNGGLGDDILIGGSGNNVAVYGGPVANYTITVVGNTVTVTDNVGGEGTDSVTGVTEFQFSDGSVFPLNNDPTPLDDGFVTDEETTFNGAGTTGLLFNDSDPDGDSLTVIVADAASANGGTVSVNADGSFSYTPPTDFAGADSFSYTVSDGFGGTATATATITVVNTNDAPSVEPLSLALDENTANGTSVGSVAASDPDVGDSLTFAIIGGNTGGAFAIDAATGEITVANSAALDFENTASFALTVQVTDLDGLSDTAVVTIDLNDVNDVPETAPQNFAVDENVANGTSIGSVAASDPDAGDSLTFAIIGGNTNGAFAIDAVTGEITVANSAALDFETTASFALTVQVTDSGGLSDSDIVTIDLGDVNEAPTVSLINTLTNLSEDTDTTLATKVADIVVSDDALGTNVLTLTGTDAALFQIVGTELFLIAGAALDFETDPQLDVTVIVDDATVGITPDDTASLAITVTDANEAPTVSLANTLPSLAEDADTSAAIKVADIVVTDDALGTNDLTLTGADAALFQIVGLELFLIAGAALDFETNPQLDVTVVVDDAAIGAGAEDTAPLAITVTDVNEAPTVALINTLANLPEDFDTSLATKVADIVVSDDALGSNDLSLTGADAALFQIVGTELFLIAGAALDFETNPQLDVNVVVDDAAVGGTPDDTAPLAIAVTNINETPVLDLDGDDSTAAGLDFATLFTEGGAAVLLSDSDLALSDVDSPNLAGATITLTNLLQSELEFLTIDVTAGGTVAGINLDFIGEAGSGTTFLIELSGAASQADYAAVLATVAYGNDSTDLDITDRIIEFVVSDGTLDSAVATATVSLNSLPNAGTSSTVTLDEDDLKVAGGASFDGNDFGPEPLSATGSLGIDFGADGPGSITAADGPSGITSLGVPVTYSYSAATQTLTASAGARTVFEIVFDAAAGTYTATLMDSLDHAPGGAENILQLDFTFTATDGNGDPVDSGFSVDITDDDPEFFETGTGTTLDEDDLTVAGGASFDGNGSAPVLLTDTGNLDFALGADGGSVTAASLSTALTSQGDPVTTSFDAATQTLTASAGGRTIFQVVFDAVNGTYDVTLMDNLDHASGNGENNLFIDIDYSFVDGDGDSGSSDLFVNVVDDVPIASNDFDLVEEGASTDGNVITGVDANDPDGSPDETEADSLGADGFGDISSISQGENTYNRDSEGSNVISNDGTVIVIATDLGGTLQFNFDTGDYLYNAPDPGIIDGDTFETFGYTLVDGDGDTAGATLTMNVTTAEPRTITWTNGAGDGDWTTRDNWDLGRAPIDGDDVIIDSQPGPVLLGDQAFIGSLTVTAGALAVNGGGLMNVAGAATFDGDSIFNLLNSTFAGSGNLTLGGMSNLTNASISGSGALNLNGTTNVSGAGNSFTDRTVVNNGTMSFAASAALALIGGSFENAVGGLINGDVTIDATAGGFTNNGTINPGASPGDFEVIGDFVQGTGATLIIEIDGSGNDLVTISGNATLGGTLEIVLLSAFDPVDGTVFEIIDVGGLVSGAFSNVILPAGLALAEVNGLFTITDTGGPATPFDDVLFGTPVGDLIDALGGNDIVDGREGADTLLGNSGADSLTGGSGADTLSGGSGADTLIGGPDADTLNGGPGQDTADYSSSDFGIDVDIGAGTAQDGFDFLDTLINIEIIIGSDFADNLTGGIPVGFTGPGVPSVTLHGGLGNDMMFGTTDSFSYFRGQEGDDSYFGSATGLKDVADYRLDPLGITAAFFVVGQGIIGTVSDGFGGTDSLQNISFVWGSNHDDVMLGTGSQTFVGWDGADTLQNGAINYNFDPSGVTIDLSGDLGDNRANGFAIDGFGDVDTLIDVASILGSNFGDTITGSELADNIIDGFNFADDTLDGGLGNDRIQSSGGADTVTGGGGSDLFLFSVDGLGLATPEITDPEVGENLSISGGGFSGNFAGPVTVGTGAGLLEGMVAISETNGVTTLFLGLDATAGSDGSILLNDRFLTSDLSPSGFQISILTNRTEVEGTAMSDELGSGGVDAWMLGFGGDDFLFGGADDDVLDGGLGRDSLEGGSGSDVFVLREGDGGATLLLADVISDFVNDGEVEFDRIGLDGGLTFDDLTIANSDNGAVISVQNAQGAIEYLAVVEGVSASLLDENDFILMA